MSSDENMPCPTCGSENYPHGEYGCTICKRGVEARKAMTSDIIQDKYGPVLNMLALSAEHSVCAEVVVAALTWMKENPGREIREACDYALNEWDI